MSENVESQGKTVEEAVSEALLVLGARHDEVEIEILEEGRSGFLGVIGSKPARVLVSRKLKSRRGRRGGVRAQSGEGRPRRDAKKPSGKGPRKAPKAERGARREKANSSQPGPAPNPEARPTGPEHRATERSTPVESITVEEVPDTLQEFATELMRFSGFPCRCEVKQGEYHLVKVVTDDSSAGILIGRHGTTVDALEHLVERMSSRALGERVNMNLDVNNYRRRREEGLAARALEVVERVQATGREFHMEPLCARERRVVHLEVAKVHGLRSYTLADSRGKHVVVSLGQGEMPGEDFPEVQATEGGVGEVDLETSEATPPGQDSPDGNSREP
jgi:spoIIIJ-associated protein